MVSTPVLSKVSEQRAAVSGSRPALVTSKTVHRIGTNCGVAYPGVLISEDSIMKPGTYLETRMPALGTSMTFEASSTVSLAGLISREFVIGSKFSATSRRTPT